MWATGLSNILHSARSIKEVSPQRSITADAVPCGAKTRAGHPCRRQGRGRGGRCPNHGGMSSGPRTEVGLAQISAAQKRRWVSRSPADP
jgi:hypothetical protein